MTVEFLFVPDRFFKPVLTLLAPPIYKRLWRYTSLAAR
jgi:hypothetical protein